MENLFLVAAAADKSAAYLAGYLCGAVFILGIIPTLFVISLVKFMKTKSAGWLVGVCLFGCVTLFLAAVFAVGVLQRFMATARTEDWTITSTDNRITLRVPGHWKKLEDLNDAASIQVGSPIREEYLVVLSQPKADFEGDLTDFAQAATKEILQALATLQTSKRREERYNGMKAVQYELSGSVDKVRIRYLHTSLEGKDTYYQIIAWTLRSRKAEAFPVFEQVLQSVRELQK